MSSIMAEPTNESIATRETLLNRLKDCQMFELYVVRQWPAREVARTLGIRARTLVRFPRFWVGSYAAD